MTTFEIPKDLSLEELRHVRFQVSDDLSVRLSWTEDGFCYVKGLPNSRYFFFRRVGEKRKEAPLFERSMLFGAYPFNTVYHLHIGDLL